MAELDVMPGMDKLPSINPDFDVTGLPDFEEDAPKKKKQKNKKNKRDKNTSKKTKSKNTPNISASSNDSNKSESKSKLQRTPKQISNKKTSSKKKQKKKTQPRKTSSIRDRIKQYDTMTKKAKDDMNKSSLKKRSKSKEPTNKKSKNNTDKKSKKKKRKKDTNSKTKKNTANNQKQSEQTSLPETNTNKQPKNDNTKSKISQEPTLIKQIGFTSNHSNDININNISPIASKTENAESFDFDEKKVETNDRQMSSEAQMLASISPMTSEHLEYTALYTGDTMDTVKIHDSDSDIELENPKLSENKSAVDELINKHVSIEPPGPPPAYGIGSLDLPPPPEDITKDISFEAMYEPAYRHDAVKFKSLKSGTGNHGSDGDLMRDAIKQQIAEKEEKKAKLKRKQSKTTAFDKKNVTGVNLWGRKMNNFAIKNGQQMIVEWRFVSSDDNAHTLVLQHEQIKRKKKSKRMVILDGNEKYSDKSKKIEFKINVDGCIDVLNINIECQDEKAMKYNYRLKINNVAYSAVFFKWSKANK